MFARFAILMHEAAHRILFTNRRANDTVGQWLIAFPVFVPMADAESPAPCAYTGMNVT